MINLKKIYEFLPYPLKVMAASLHGYQLRHWRYGSKFEELVSAAFERETWSQKKWEVYQEAKLQRILDHAYKLVPYYKDAWSARRRKGDTSSHLELANWPILTKEELRNYPKAFLADDAHAKKLFPEHTSGTTGTPLYLWCSRKLLHEWYALFETRWRRWYGLNFSDRWGMLGGQLVSPVKRNKPPFWVWNQGLNQLYMSVIHLKPDWTLHYGKAIEQHKIVYLYGYTSALYLLAHGLLENGIEIPLKAVITNAEPLFDYQKSTIEECFKCRVIETYGQAEMVTAASECEYGSLHLWPEAGITEIVDDEYKPVIDQKPGRLVATGLMNIDMPLIRYDMLDWFIPSVSEHQCKCGRTLPIIKGVIGRNDDMILLRDGRRVFQIDTIFGSHLKIKEAQIVQETLDDFIIKVVPAEGFSQSEVEELQTELKDRLGQINVCIETVDEIPRTFRGKFRIIISKVTNPQQTELI